MKPKGEKIGDFNESISRQYFNNEINWKRF